MVLLLLPPFIFYFSSSVPSKLLLLCDFLSFLFSSPFVFPSRYFLLSPVLVFLPFLNLFIIYLNSLSLSMVVSLFKKGDQENVSNYRPISLLPVLSKILEKIVSNQLLDFLLRNNLLSNSQHGFRPNLSTESALLKVTDAIRT